MYFGQADPKYFQYYKIPKKFITLYHFGRISCNQFRKNVPLNRQQAKMATTNQSQQLREHRQFYRSKLTSIRWYTVFLPHIHLIHHNSLDAHTHTHYIKSS